MLEIILFAFLSYRNSLLAKQKGQNQFLWVFITFVTAFIAAMIGFFIVVFFFLGNGVNWQDVSKDPKYFDEVQKAITSAFINNPLHEMVIDALGVGGYLLMRYILEHMPDKKEKKNEPETDIHWMDKYKANEEK